MIGNDHVIQSSLARENHVAICGAGTMFDVRKPCG
jgi:hypothetical protein